MGRIEDSVQKEIRKTRITRAVITTLAVSGGLAVALVAPNVLGAISKVIPTPQRRQSVKRSFNKLIKYGYIKIENGKAVLTLKGEHTAALLGEGKLAPKKPHKWDGKWRVLIFDILERRRNTRNRLRNALRQLGFKHLQHSVWVSPYDCEDLINILKVDFRLGKSLLYLVVHTMELDIALKEHFGLR